MADAAHTSSGPSATAHTASVAQPAVSDAAVAPPPVATGALVTLILAVSCALVFSFLCSLCEAVLLSVSRGQVEAMAKKGSRAGKILRGWKRGDIEAPIAAILILNTLAHTVGALVAGSSFQAVSRSPQLFAIFNGTFTLAILVLTEIIPKTLGVAFANQLAMAVTLFVRGLTVVLSPVLWLTSRVSKWLTGEQRKPVTSVEEIRLLAALGRHEGDVGPRVADFIEGIASLAELTVYDVMVPRGGLAFLSGSRTFEENLDTIRESGHSRFPFTPTGDLDDVDSVVLAKELLFLDHDHPGEEADWTKLKHPLLVVPEGKALDQVLRLFQEQRKHLAVVVDEYGGTMGVITLEDVIEEIVGEIEDEFDRVETLIVKRSDGSLLCRGRAEMRKLFRVLNLDDRVEVVTVAGFVAEQLGRVPLEGDEVRYKHLLFRVIKATRRRAERVEVVAAPQPEADPDHT